MRFLLHAPTLRRSGVAAIVVYAVFGLPFSPVACAHGIDLDLEPLPGEGGSSNQSGPMTGGGGAPSGGLAGSSVSGGVAGSSSSGGPGGRGDAQGVGGMGPSSSSAGGAAGTQSSGNAGDGGSINAGAGGAGGPTAVGSSGAGGVTGGGGSGGGLGGASGRGGMAGAAGQGGSGGQAGAGGATGGSGGIPLADAGPPVTVDDAVTGTGNNQFNYVGTWGHCTACTTPTTPPLYNGTNSWSDGGDAGAAAFVTLAFIGQEVSFYGVVDPRNGIGAISIDGGAETSIDFYSATREGNRLLFKSAVLARGTHSFRLRFTGMHNTSSSGSTVVVDRVDIQ